MKRLLSVAACVAAVPAIASAQTVPDIGFDVTTLTTDMGTKMGSAVGTVVGIAFALGVIFFGVKVVRKHMLGRA